jgi:predicted nucleotide-binding protein
MGSGGMPAGGMSSGGMSNSGMGNAGMANGGMPNSGMAGMAPRMDAAPMHPQTHGAHAHDEAEEEAEHEAPPVRYTQPPMSHGPSHGHPPVLGRGAGNGQVLPKTKAPARLGRGVSQQPVEQVSIIARGLLISVAEEDVAGGVVKKFLADMGVDLLPLNAPARGGEELVAAVDALEKASNVSFALVSVGEDEAATRLGEDVELQDGSAIDRVAIFLLGVLVGKMGLKRVCVLHPSGSNPTPDPSGITHVAIDESGGWQLQLARQLKRAGVHLDLNRLF